MKLFASVVGLLAAGIMASGPAAAQVWDPTGNNQLNGSYYFREVLYPVGDQAGDLSDGISIYGAVTFNGNGTYSITSTSTSSQAALFDAMAGQIEAVSSSGTYTIGASGHGFINWSISALGVNYVIKVLVANGVVVGSSTDNSYGVNELFLATPIASPALTASAFNGSYSLVYINPVESSIFNVYDALVTLSANGSGGIGTASVTGYIGTNGSTAFKVNESGITYTFSGGAAVVNFPKATTNPVLGTVYLYFSPTRISCSADLLTGADMIVESAPAPRRTLEDSITRPASTWTNRKPPPAATRRSTVIMARSARTTV